MKNMAGTNRDYGNIIKMLDDYKCLLYGLAFRTPCAAFTTVEHRRIEYDELQTTEGSIQQHQQEHSQRRSLLEHQVYHVAQHCPKGRVSGSIWG
jgi:hypothetical protein